MIPKPGGKLPPAGHPDRAGPGGASRPQAGARADLRGGLSSRAATASVPKRRAQDAIAEIHHLQRPAPMSGCWRVTSRRASTRSTTPALMDRVRRRIGDKRVLGAGEGVPQGRHPLRGWRSSGTRAPAPRKAGSSHRCWPTSPCRSSTITSPRPGQAMGDSHARRSTSTQGSGHLPPRPLRGRLRGAGGRRPAPTPKRLRDEVAAVLAPDGAAPVGGEDEDRPHRRGLRLPRVPHPAAPEARHGQALRLHLPLEEGARLDQGQGAKR